MYICLYKRKMIQLDHQPNKAQEDWIINFIEENIDKLLDAGILGEKYAEVQDKLIIVYKE